MVLTQRSSRRRCRCFGNGRLERIPMVRPVARPQKDRARRAPVACRLTRRIGPFCEPPRGHPSTQTEAFFLLAARDWDPTYRMHVRGQQFRLVGTSPAAGRIADAARRPPRSEPGCAPDRPRRPCTSRRTAGVAMVPADVGERRSAARSRYDPDNRRGRFDRCCGRTWTGLPMPKIPMWAHHAREGVLERLAEEMERNKGAEIIIAR